MTTKTIEEIYEAFDKVHRRAMGETRDVYMSIPARPDKDADLIVTAAIRELAALRTRVQELTAERDKWLRIAHEKADDVARHVKHSLDMQAVVRDEEREACAKVCEANANRFDADGVDSDLHHAHMADARDIRARGKL